jgi:cell division protein FtsL
VKEESKVDNSNEPIGGEYNIMQLLSGNILTREVIKKHLWYFLFLVALSVVYINNKYQTEGLLINIIRLQNEVKENRDRSVSYAAELMSLSRESEVIKIVNEKNLNLQELKMPPEKIEIKK